MKQHRYKPGKFYLIDLAHMLNELFEVPYDQHYRRPVFGKKIVNAIFTTIASALQRGEVVKIKGFGTFKIYTTPKRQMPNLVIHSTGDPKTNTKSTISIEKGGKKIVIFQPSIQLMAMLNHQTPNYKEHRSMLIWPNDDH